MKKKDDAENKLSDVKVRYITQYLVGKEILDVGAGYAYYSEWLASTNSELKIVATDQLELASYNGIEFVHANLEKPIPCSDQSFSTILAFDIIEHINHEKNLIRELHRICKPGGVLIGSVPHDDDRFLPSYNLAFYHRSDLTHKRYYTPETIKQALEAEGFSNVIIEKEGGVSPHVFAEFFPQKSRFLIKKGIGLLRRMHIIDTSKLSSDLFFIARKI